MPLLLMFSSSRRCSRSSAASLILQNGIACRLRVPSLHLEQLHRFLSSGVLLHDILKISLDCLCVSAAPLCEFFSSQYLPPGLLRLVEPMCRAFIPVSVRHNSKQAQDLYCLGGNKIYIAIQKKMPTPHMVQIKRPAAVIIIVDCLMTNTRTWQALETLF